MENVNKIRTGRHCVFRMRIHLVFATKYRCGVFIKAILDNLLYCANIQKFQLRCALYPRPEDRGFTARWIKKETRSYF